MLLDRGYADDRYNCIKMSHIGSLFGDGMTYHVVQCYQAGISDIQSSDEAVGC